MPCRPIRFSFPCLAQWIRSALAYRCGGSTGLTLRRTGFPFHLVKGTRTKGVRKACLGKGVKQEKRSPGKARAKEG
jgi:hypothetical protein